VTAAARAAAAAVLVGGGLFAEGRASARGRLLRMLKTSPGYFLERVFSDLLGCYHFVSLGVTLSDHMHCECKLPPTCSAGANGRWQRGPCCIVMHVARNPGVHRGCVHVYSIDSHDGHGGKTTGLGAGLQAVAVEGGGPAGPRRCPGRPTSDCSAVPFLFPHPVAQPWRQVNSQSAREQQSHAASRAQLSSRFNLSAPAAVHRPRSNPHARSPRRRRCNRTHSLYRNQSSGWEAWGLPPPSRL